MIAVERKTRRSVEGKRISVDFRERRKSKNVEDVVGKKRRQATEDGDAKKRRIEGVE